MALSLAEKRASGGIKNRNVDEAAGIQLHKINKLYRFAVDNFTTQGASSNVVGGAASGTAQAKNVYNNGRVCYEYSPVTAQTILAPSLSTNGLDISLDQTSADGVEFVPGANDLRGAYAFTVGTDAFYLRVKAQIADVSGANLHVGFRKVQSYAAALTTYTDYFCLFMDGTAASAAQHQLTYSLNSSAATTDTTQVPADATAFTYEVQVDARGQARGLIDGVSPTVNYTGQVFDTGDVLIPFIYLTHTADLAGTVELIELKCGLSESNVRGFTA